MDSASFLDWSLTSRTAPGRQDWRAQSGAEGLVTPVTEPLCLGARIKFKASNGMWTSFRERNSP
jgi:hypothetical protein